VRYRALFRDVEFTGMYVADVLTMAGTYLSRLAVAVLVYERTGSVGLTGLTFAVSFAPYLFAPILSILADVLPRKRLLVVSDLLRALLVLVLLIPHLPIPVLLVVLFTLELIQIPFGGARLATLADVLPDDRFSVGNALVASTRQAVQVGGFVLGGALVAATAPQTALAIDAMTYALSAALIGIFVRHRPLPWGPGNPAPTVRAAAAEGLRFVTRTPGMPHLFVLLALGPAMIVIAEGLAVPFADQLDGGTRLAGVIMATAPIGNVIGFAVAGRLTLATQRRLVYPLAAAGGLAVALAGLVGVVGRSPAAVVVVLVVGGGTLAYLNAIQSEVASVVPRVARGRVFGLANAVMMLAQGLAVALAGLLAERESIGIVLALVGTSGMLVVGLVYGASARHRARAETHL
jgi:predicted ribosomally synthesized peptide with SipW-like signal peptide